MRCFVLGTPGLADATRRADDIIRLAETEGLDAHARRVKLRRQG